ncbi:unnamed protein product [Effrenium voratum]|uniref:Uncharacterized protein n=2 Tax=Effrenium voratum TaxID=2562239 RepID=A0AA36ISE7_9DINO|nr:unnamed protein product [Effrenium voratum]
MRWPSRLALTALGLLELEAQPVEQIPDDECTESGCALQALQRQGRRVADAQAWNEVMAALVPKIQKMVFEDGQLAVSKEMREAMRGTCLSSKEYVTAQAPFDDFWQCASEDNDNFGASAYCPSRRVAQRLANFTGLDLKVLEKLHLQSGNESAALYGKWCGMPAPPEYEDAYSGPVGNRAFWEDCVMRNSGYFNALKCDTNGSYAVLGIAALNHGVCYPAHRHDNQEAYWQIAGPGWWKTWPESFSDKPNMKPYSEIRVTSANDALRLHNHAGGLIHEMDTTFDDDFLLAVYWWGKPVYTTVNYAYSHGVVEQGSCFASFRREHLDAAHSCPEVARPEWATEGK